MKLRVHNLGVVTLLLLAYMPAKLPKQALAEQAADSHSFEIGILVTATRPQAAALLKELRAGMDFGVLAKEKSIDPTAKDGGYMGRLNPGRLEPQLRDALRGLSIGQIHGRRPTTSRICHSHPVRSSSNYEGFSRRPYP